MAHYWRAALAQLVEQLSCKQQVIGSSPIGGSTDKRPRADESRRGAFCCARRYWRVWGFRSKAVDVLTLGRAGLVCGVLCCGRGRGLACPGVCVVCGVLACVEESDVGLLGCRGTSRVGVACVGLSVVCRGRWRVWRKALSGCWGAVVRRGWGQWCFGPWRAMSWASRQGVGSSVPPDCDLDVVWGLVCGLRLCVGSSPTQEQRNGATEEQRSCGTRATAHILLTGERLLP